MKLVKPKLHIRSRKSPDAEGFSEHRSKLDEIALKPFYLEWNNGKVERVLLPQDEPLSNIKKGIAGVFQVSTLHSQALVLITFRSSSLRLTKPTKQMPLAFVW